jgi:hypothetical protein
MARSFTEEEAVAVAVDTSCALIVGGECVMTAKATPRNKEFLRIILTLEEIKEL